MLAGTMPDVPPGSEVERMKDTHAKPGLTALSTRIQRAPVGRMARTERCQPQLQPEARSPCGLPTAGRSFLLLVDLKRLLLNFQSS